MRVYLDSSALLKRVVEEADAIHVASAMLLDADLLITYDDRMADSGHENGLRCAAPGR